MSHQDKNIISAAVVCGKYIVRAHYYNYVKLITQYSLLNDVRIRGNDELACRSADEVQ
jgi:hypothetical protein